MKSLLIVTRPAIAAAGLALLAGIGLSQVAMAQNHPPAPPAQLGPVKVLVIDRQALMRASSVGQDIARQVQELTKSAEAELKGEGEALQRERQALDQQVAILAPDVKAQKIKAFQSKAAAFQQRVNNRQVQIR